MLKKIIIGIVISILLCIYYNFILKREKIYHPILKRNVVSEEDRNKFSYESLKEKFSDYRLNVYFFKSSNRNYDFTKEMSIDEFFRINQGEYRIMLKNIYNLDENRMYWINRALEKYIGPKIEQVLVYNLRIVYPNWTWHCHYDMNDNYYINIVGRRKVYLTPFMIGSQFEKYYVDNMKAVLANSKYRENTIEYILEPGDMLYIPKGYYHYFESVGEEISVVVNYLGNFSVENPIMQRIWNERHADHVKVIANMDEYNNIVKKK